MWARVKYDPSVRVVCGCMGKALIKIIRHKYMCCHVPRSGSELPLVRGDN